jgi:hypothetical protein
MKRLRYDSVTETSVKFTHEVLGSHLHLHLEQRSSKLVAKIRKAARQSQYVRTGSFAIHGGIISMKLRNTDEETVKQVLGAFTKAIDRSQQADPKPKVRRHPQRVTPHQQVA